jgi:oligopeptide transport system ATP-binding protein
MAADEHLLDVREVSKAFRVGRRSPGPSAQSLTALDEVSLSVRTHEIVGVVGESGSGKSTLAKCMVRLVEPDSGAVEFRSRDVLGLKKRELARARRAMQMIYQDPHSSLNPLMSVGAAIAEPARVHGLVDGRELNGYVRGALDVVGLARELAERRPRDLSGGQRQRVAIARAMAVKPELLLADEAVSALDVSIQAQILNLFSRLREEQGVAIVFIAHDLAVVASIADRVNVMYLGAVMETGPTAEVFAAPGHPYTTALLGAQPGRQRRRRARKPALRGEIPSGMTIPSGCRFRTRCPLAQDVCREVAPPAVDLGNGRTARCHFAQDVVSGRRLPVAAA